jgi:ubiquinone/menaquinone biosynthesis C-methylase UbiE
MVGREHRTEEGWQVYADGMERSSPEKRKLLPFMKEGTIVDVGCGYGTVINLLSEAFPESRIIGVDNSRKMLEMAKSRGFGYNVDFLEADITKPYLRAESADTMNFSSVFHEIYSFQGLSPVQSALDVSYGILKKGGRLIIRDGVKPECVRSRIEIGTPENVNKFVKFAQDFTPYKIAYKRIDDHTVELSRANVMEFLSKYIYDTNWDVEVQEQFGIFSLADWQKTLRHHGFNVIHTESYLIPFLRQRYETDEIKLFSVVNKGNNTSFQEADYPDSTMILVAEKI